MEFVAGAGFGLATRGGELQLGSQMRGFSPHARPDRLFSCSEVPASCSCCRCSHRRQQMHDGLWVSEAFGALDWLNGRPLGQKLEPRQIRETLQALGPAPFWRVSPTICRRRKQCSAPKDLLLCRVMLSRPAMTDKAKQETCGCTDHILRDHESQGGCVRSHFDPRLGDWAARLDSRSTRSPALLPSSPPSVTAAERCELYGAPVALTSIVSLPTRPNCPLRVRGRGWAAACCTSLRLTLSVRPVGLRAGLSEPMSLFQLSGLILPRIVLRLTSAT